MKKFLLALGALTLSASLFAGTAGTGGLLTEAIHTAGEGYDKTTLELEGSFYLTDNFKFYFDYWDTDTEKDDKYLSMRGYYYTDFEVLGRKYTHYFRRDVSGNDETFSYTALLTGEMQLGESWTKYDATYIRGYYNMKREDNGTLKDNYKGDDVHTDGSTFMLLQENYFVGPNYFEAEFNYGFLGSDKSESKNADDAAVDPGKINSGGSYTWWNLEAGLYHYYPINDIIKWETELYYYANFYSDSDLAGGDDYQNASFLVGPRATFAINDNTELYTFAHYIYDSTAYDNNFDNFENLYEVGLGFYTKW